MGVAAITKHRDGRGSGAAPERGNFAASPGQGRVRAEWPPPRGETGDRP